jgi:hypothetical protein
VLNFVEDELIGVLVFEGIVVVVVGLVVSAYADV